MSERPLATQASRSPSPSRSPKGNGERTVSRGKGSRWKKCSVPLVEKDTDVVGSEVADHGIEVAVAVEVTEGDGPRGIPHGNGRRWKKCSVPLVEEDADVAGASVCNAGIEIAVAVEVTYSDGDRLVSHGKRGGSGGKKRAIPLVQKDADVVGEQIGDAGIEVAVSVEVPERDGVRPTLCCKGKRNPRRKERRPRPLVEEDAHVSGREAGIEVGHARIEIAVTVEVSEGDGDRSVPHGKGGGSGWKKGAVPLIQQGADVVGESICGHGIEIAVAVEVSEGDGFRSIPHREGSRG